MYFHLIDVCTIQCQNGGMGNADCTACDCVDGYEGSLCEMEIGECLDNPCQNGGTCTDGINSFTCHCVEGFTGSNCETDINECSPNPCQNGGTCTNGINSFACHCVEGYTGSN